jgi:PAS domain S-box-containing protein
MNKESKKIIKDIPFLKEDFNSLLSHKGYVFYTIDTKTFLPKSFEGNIESITGYPNNLFFNGSKKWFELIHKKDRELFKKEFEKIRKRKNYVSDIEYRIIDNQGKIKWIKNIANKISVGKTKKETIIRGVVFEITKTKVTEELLKESQTKLKSFFKDNPGNILIINPLNKRIISANNAACRFYGWSRSELTKMKISDINILPEDELAKEMELARKQKKSYFSFKHQIADGSIRDVEVSSGPVILKGKHLLYSVIKDVTEKKQYEEMFKQSFLISPDSISINRIRDGAYVDINNTFTKLTGYTRDEVIGKSSEDLGIWANVNDKTKLVKTLGKGEEVLNLETQFRSKDGTIKTGLMSAIIMDVSGEKCILSITRDITERIKFEQDLRISEEKFSKVFKISPDSINITRLKDGVYLDINDGYTALTGYTREDVIGKSAVELNVWVSVEDRSKLVYELTEKGKITNFEAHFRIKNGSIRTGLVSANLIEIEGEKCILIIVRDITERKLADEALKRHAHEMWWLMKSMANAFVVWDSVFDESGNFVDFKFGYFNDAYSKVSGLKLEDVQEKRVSEVWPTTEQSWYDIYGEVAKTGIPKTFEMYHAPTKGIYLCNAYRPWNTPDRICVVFEDVTDKKVAEEALRESEERFHLIFEKSGAAMLLLDPETGNIIDANTAASAFYGYTRHEFCSMKVTELNTINDEDLRRLRTQSLKGQQNYFVLDQKLKSQEIKTVETYTSPMNINGKIYIFSIIHDITERIKAEQALLEAKNKAEVSEELKSAFLAQMSHEIRSPLYRILGYVSLIKDFINSSKIKTDEEIKDYFGSIDLSSSRLTRTIDSILNMSELQTQSYHSSFGNVNLYDLIKRLYKEYQVQADLKNIHFNFVCRTKNSVVYCDEYSVTQILANLIDNALKYTQQGNVTIILDRNDKQGFFIEVRDTGIGISKDFLNQLFAPFTQEEIGYTRKFDGNGLGLALVKNYCDINNATVKVESEKGKGSIFRITFKEKGYFLQ